MKTTLSISSLLLVLFTAGPVCAEAGSEDAGPLTAPACSAAREQFDAMAVLFAQAEELGHERLAQALEPRLDGLLANRPTAPALRTQASALLGDIRDSIDILRGASKPAIHQLALQRLEQDHLQYGKLLDAAGCPESAPR